MVPTYSFMYFSNDIARFIEDQAPQIQMGETLFVKDIPHHDETLRLYLQPIGSVAILWQCPILKIGYDRHCLVNSKGVNLYFHFVNGRGILDERQYLTGDVCILSGCCFSQTVLMFVLFPWDLYKLNQEFLAHLAFDHAQVFFHTFPFHLVVAIYVSNHNLRIVVYDS